MNTLIEDHMIDFKDKESLTSLISEQFSDWSAPLEITQEMVDQFAELTGDKLWIHTDPEKCAKSGMESTIAHGFLMLSLLSRMRTGEDISTQVSGYKQIMNYGSDKLRFLSPVWVGSRVHARQRVIGVDVNEQKTTVTLGWEIATVGNDRANIVYNMNIVFF